MTLVRWIERAWVGEYFVSSLGVKNRPRDIATLWRDNIATIGGNWTKEAGGNLSSIDGAIQGSLKEWTNGIWGLMNIMLNYPGLGVIFRRAISKSYRCIV